MTKKKKWVLIGAGALVVAALVTVNLARSRDRGTEVEIGKVARKALTQTVSASGTINPQNSVNVSATTIGKVTRLAVAEGETVRSGQFLLEIDPAEYASVVRSLEAVVRTAQADLRLAEAQQEKAELDLRRARDLFDQGLQTQEQLTAFETARRVQAAQLEAARSRLRQQEASLDKARYDLDKVTITAPLSGLITRLNVKEGESAIMGTLNNPGTVLLTIADMAVLEARVQIDETEVVKVALGQPAKIEIDAFPDTSFAGRVTEIGNSPIYTGTGAGQQAVDFEVKITLDERVPGIRPGLSAKAEIETATRAAALAAPIGAVTVRKWPPEERPARGRRGRAAARAAKAAAAADTAAAAAADTAAGRTGAKRPEKEGVFVVEDGVARFRLVKLGITGEEDFELLEGVQEGDRIVTGPFRKLRDLQHGDAVKEAKQRKGAAGGGERERGGGRE